MPDIKDVMVFVAALAWPVTLLLLAYWFRKPLLSVAKRVASVRMKDSEITWHPEQDPRVQPEGEYTLPAQIELKLEDASDDADKTVLLPDSLYEGILYILALQGFRTDEEDEFTPNMARELFKLLYRSDQFKGLHISAPYMERMARATGLFTELATLLLDETEEPDESDTSEQGE